MTRPGLAEGRFLDNAGNPVSPELEERSIGLDLADVLSARLAVAVASGEAKFAVAEACVRRGLCHVLVTDELTAAYLIRHLAAPDQPNERTTS